MMNIVNWPEELVKKPKPLIALTGLDIEHNNIHKSIWEGFSKIRRQDRAPLNFSYFPIKHEYPKCKTKRVNYEWYVPKGVLKSHWMQKQMEEVPAMVVVFFDLEWDEIQWKEKISECASLVALVKKNIQGRATKIVVVLIQKRALMPGEDSHTEPRAQNLCQVCDLAGNRNLFMLPTTESLFGYITRLEREFQDLAANYYQSQIKKVKGHKENLNKTTHQLLFIRHHFKIAFFQEFRQDLVLALKNYKQAYAYIMELRMLDTHILEIKTVAGYINYKICCLSFQNNASDAISQFRRHTDFFKGICGPPDLAFEHEAWISKQFEVMGDLFRDAIKQGLTANTTQHPGLYYEEAALHAIARKRFSHPNMITSARRVNRFYNVNEASWIKFDMSSLPFISGDIQHSFEETLEFYGQRHWRQGKQSIEPPDAGKEKDAILYLQIVEKTQTNHSKMIIPLLNNAMENYQRYKANRMKLMSCVLMGEEYMHAKDYGQALKCFNKVFMDYRKERWRALQTSALLNSLKCTYLIAKMPDYVSICLELMSDNVNLDDCEKKILQNNLNLLLNNEVPPPDRNIDLEEAKEGENLWRCYISEFNPSSSKVEDLHINMNDLASCVDCKVVFPLDKFAVDNTLTFSVYLRSTAVLPLKIEKMNLSFQDIRYNDRYSFIDPLALPMDLEPKKVHQFKFKIVPISDEGSHTIRIEKVVVFLGNEDCYGHVYLQWTINMDDYLRQSFQVLEPIGFKSVNSPVPWSSILFTPFVEITSRVSRFSLEISHSSPVLLNECYPIKVAIINNELCDVSSVQLNIYTEEAAATNSFTPAKISLLPLKKTNDDAVSIRSSTGKRIELELKPLSSMEKVNEVFYVRVTTVGDIRVHIEVSYKISLEVENYSGLYQCVKSEIIESNAVQPFEVLTRLLSTFMIPMKDVFSNEPFLLQITSSNVSPITLNILKMDINLKDDVQSLDDKTDMEDRVINEQICPLESACEIHILKVLLNDMDDLSVVAVGSYVIHWHRVDYGLGELDDFKDIYNTTTITLPDIDLDLSPLTADLTMASHAICRVPFILTYILQNRTLYPLEVEAQLDMCDNFMFSGLKLIQMRILPHSFYPLNYSLLPVVSGFLTLPRFHVKLIGSSSQQLLSSVKGDCAMKNVEETVSKDVAIIAQLANLERKFEEKFLSRLPSYIFVKPSGDMKNFD